MSWGRGCVPEQGLADCPHLIHVFNNQGNLVGGDTADLKKEKEEKCKKAAEPSTDFTAGL